MTQIETTTIEDAITCTSTHCERRQECASPNECTGSAKNLLTPGLWKTGHAGNAFLWVGPDYDKPFVALIPWDSVGARDEARVNAKAIAALPELVAALAEAHRCLMNYEWYANPKSDWAAPENEHVRGAISAALKASGK